MNRAENAVNLLIIFIPNDNQEERHVMNIKLFFILSTFLFLCGCSEAVKFDSKKWKNAEGDYVAERERHKMVDDLNKTYKLRGMTITDVQKLLGAPNKINENITTYLYLTGGGEGFLQIDSRYLEINFENDVVVSFREKIL